MSSGSSSDSGQQPDDLEPALELRLSLDSHAGPAARISKDRARDLVLAAMTSAADSGQRAEPSPTTVGGGRSKRSSLAVAAAALLVAFISGASASLWVWGRRESNAEPVTQPKAAPERTPRATPAGNAPELELERDGEYDDSNSKAPARPRRAEALSEDLLERANRLRAEGAFAEARDTYAQVVRRYPSTLSAYAAQVAAGSLELEHLSQPDEARRLFERALASRPAGALSLEIYQGLAASYAALGRTRDEARTLRRLVSSYPHAHAAKRANVRLEELERVP
jgi:tetratricopeptide (TPR) repeat protein